MLEVFLDALKDTALLIPFLLAVHLLIGFLEVRKLGRIKRGGVLQSPVAPLVGTGLALLPQCGFSVVASELYAKRFVTVGTLVAVFIATSDEALPILVGEAATQPRLWGWLGLLIGIKVVMALAAGYGTDGVAALVRRAGKPALPLSAKTPETEAHGDRGEECRGHGAETHGCEAEAHEAEAHEDCGGHNAEAHEDHKTEAHGAHEAGDREHGGADEYVHTHEHGCCGHSIGGKKGGVFAKYFKHPLIHTLTITLFAFIVNFALGTVIFLAGEDNFRSFMQSAEYVQPLAAVLVGLIPNCASSVMITELFAGGSLTLGAAVAGLAVNAGLGVAVLVKENKKAGENALIVLGMVVFALAVGYALTPLGAVPAEVGI